MSGERNINRSAPRYEDIRMNDRDDNSTRRRAEYTQVSTEQQYRVPESGYPPELAYPPHAGTSSYHPSGYPQPGTSRFEYPIQPGSSPFPGYRSEYTSPLGFSPEYQPQTGYVLPSRYPPVPLNAPFNSFGFEESVVRHQPLAYSQPYLGNTKSQIGYPKSQYRMESDFSTIIQNQPHLNGGMQPDYLQYRNSFQPPAGFNAQSVVLITDPPQGGWNVTNCPPGLEYISTVDHLLINQKVEYSEVMSGFESNNQFVVKNILGQNIYWAFEDSDCCQRNCIGRGRGFEMLIKDARGTEVMHLSKSCTCCLESMIVFSPPGVEIGSIDRQFAFCKSVFHLKDVSGITRMKLFQDNCACDDRVFKLLTPDENQIGLLEKHWAGIAQELFTDADNFGLTFPMDLDPKLKIICLAAVFLIDSAFFENNNAA